MQTLTIDLNKISSFNIGQQGDHNVLRINFINLKDIGNAQKYIYFTIGDYENRVPLLNDTFIVGQPLTTHSGVVTAQIISKSNDNTVLALSRVFMMKISPSIAYKENGYPEEEYPMDPNIKYAYDLLNGLINESTNLINQFNAIDIGKYSQLMSQLNQSVNAANTSATNASQSATSAQESSTNAQTSATNAQKALDDTKDFVNQTKTELNQIKTDTSVLKDEANTSAVNAKASETKAKEYADNLQASTDDISQLKEDIGNKAPAIIEKASGKTIIINDSSNLPLKTLSGTGKVIITGKNILDDTKNGYAYFIPFEAKAGTLFTLITNGELSTGGNIKFTDENDEDVWFAIDAGKTKTFQKIQANVKGFVNLLVQKEGLKYCFSVGENDEYEEYVEQVITAPVDSEQLKAIHTNYPTTVLTSENEISVEYVADTKHYIDKKFEELNQAIVNTQIALL